MLIKLMYMPCGVVDFYLMRNIPSMRYMIQMRACVCVCARVVYGTNVVNDYPSLVVSLEYDGTLAPNVFICQPLGQVLDKVK